MHSSSGAITRKQLSTIDLEDPLGNGFLASYRTWWHARKLSPREWRDIHEVAMDGHEKVTAKCHGAPPGHGWVCNDGKEKRRQNGRFMAMDPSSGLVLAVTNMKDPENNAVARQLLHQVMESGHNKQVKYWCADRFHTKGHAPGCLCSPMNVSRLEKRLKDVNTSIAERTFSWFRGYAVSFNTAGHPHLQRAAIRQEAQLPYPPQLPSAPQPFRGPVKVASSKVGKAARVHKKPGARPYTCRRPASSRCARKRPASSARRERSP